MFKLVIADDDEILLEGLTYAFDWKQLDIQVVASVIDGDKALEAVKETGADILLTDIRMTNMDGLSLTTQIMEEGLDVSVVIMSAYDEFQYAQQAIRLNVEDYLLKSVDLDHLEKIMRQITYRKSKTREEKEEVLKMIQENKENREENFYKKLLEGRYTQEELDTYLSAVDIKEGVWQLIEVYLDEDKMTDEKLHFFRQEAETYHGRLLEWGSEKALFCFHESEDNIEDMRMQFKAGCRSRIQETKPDHILSFINSPLVKEPMQLNLAYEALQNIENYQYIEGKESDLSEQDIEKYYNSNHALNKSLIEYIAKLALIGEKKTISEYVERLKMNLKYVGNNSKIMMTFALSLFWGELNKTSIKTDKQLDKIQEEYREYYKEISIKATLDEAIECFENMVLQFTDEIQEKDHLSNQELIAQAQELIEKNFSDPELRLVDVADYVNLSPNYFSTVFKEITGKGFAEYLLECRMKEAQHLIVMTKDKSGEIAAKVGYDNATYFSTTFKKYVGMTVSQYRKMISP